MGTSRPHQAWPKLQTHDRNKCSQPHAATFRTVSCATTGDWKESPEPLACVSVSVSVMTGGAAPAHGTAERTTRPCHTELDSVPNKTVSPTPCCLGTWSLHTVQMQLVEVGPHTLSEGGPRSNGRRPPKKPEAGRQEPCGGGDQGDGSQDPPPPTELGAGQEGPPGAATPDIRRAGLHLHAQSSVTWHAAGSLTPARRIRKEDSSDGIF